MSGEEKPKTEFLTYSQIHSFLNNQGGESESVLFQTKTSLSQDLSDQFLFKTISNNAEDNGLNAPSPQHTRQSMGNESQNDLAYSISQANESNFPFRTQMAAIDEVSLCQESSSNVTNQLDTLLHSSVVDHQMIKGLEKSPSKNATSNLIVEKLQAEIIELKNQNTELNLELKNQILTSQLAAEELGAENEQRKNQVKALKQELSYLKVEYQLKIETLLKNTKPKADRQTEEMMKSLQEKIDQLKENCQQQKQKEEQLEATIKEKDSLISKQNGEIKSLKEQQKIKDQKFNSLQDLFKRTDNDVKNQNQKLRELEKENEQLKKQVASKQQDSVARNSNSTKQLILKMQQEQQNLKQVTQNINSIYNQLETELFDNSFDSNSGKKSHQPSLQKVTFINQPTFMKNQNQNQNIQQLLKTNQPSSGNQTMQNQLLKLKEQISLPAQNQKVPLIINSQANATFPTPIFVQYPSNKNLNGRKQ